MGDRLICTRPFQHFEVAGRRWPMDEAYEGGSRGDVFLCCPTWMPTPVGNLMEKPLAELWNGETAQRLRRSILDGSFEYCERDRCPFLATATGPVSTVDRVRDPEVRRAIAEERLTLDYGPKWLHMSYDRACNLSCPSCRTELTMEKGHEARILALTEKLEAEVFPSAEVFYITGSGDPFGSPFFFALLRKLTPDDVPKLREIRLHSNGLLWTRRNWGAIREPIRALIKNAHISIDAAAPETYAVNRRGGELATLLRNLEFIGELRRAGPLETFTISMVVQENNFLEMAEFVRLGRRFGVDHTFFIPLVNWGTFSSLDFAARAIHRPSHPRHAELLRVLADPIFDARDVELGVLAGAAPAPAAATP